MRKNTFVTLLFVAATSCVIGIVIKDLILPEAIAQAAPTNVQSAGQYSECFGATMWRTSGRSLNNGQLPKKTVKVPEGWSVVGGGYGGSTGGVEPVMILCR